MTITMGFGIISITIEYIMKCTTHLNHYLLKNKVKNNKFIHSSYLIVTLYH